MIKHVIRCAHIGDHKLRTKHEIQTRKGDLRMIESIDVQLGMKLKNNVSKEVL